LGPIPKKWKGVCAGGSNFSCNKKIIGARFYGSGVESARDIIGHGTHTTSTTGGREVKGVSFDGLAKGTARGGVPSSRIATYKVCDSPRCSGDAILAAFDDAIADGVDVITISMGSNTWLEFVNDPIAIGSFHAMEKGILTTHAVGNSGPYPSSISSVSPWLFSVAATSINRQFITKLILGNGKTFIGTSIYTGPSNGTKLPIAGKLVLCGAGGLFTSDIGLIGSILNVTDAGFDISSVTYKPSLNLKTKDFVQVQSYTNSTKYPIAEILKSEIFHDTNAPKVPIFSYRGPNPLVLEIMKPDISAPILKSEIFHDTNAPKVPIFSSRGPNPLVLEIMKPDISAPGMNILAAYSPFGESSGDMDDKRKFKYSLATGTSMACPHVAGVVAYVKSFHPDWSPAAIKSAIMTTAKPVKGTYADLTGEYAYGSGNINP
ncbi:subtilisin-like serine protease, partial [Trifolium medium]|nr:subtilisin-like serine protease [Trifolium medium]